MCCWIYFRDGFVNRNIPKTKKAVINTTSLLSTETVKKKRDEDCAPKGSVVATTTARRKTPGKALPELLQ